MRIVICDDNLIITEQLSNYIKEFFDRIGVKCPEISVYDNGESLLQDKREKDIAFLDVEMSGISGIHIGRELKNENKYIIIFIVTAFAEYLDEAMRFHVFRYFTKPVDKHRLFRNMKDALQLYNSTTAKIAVETKQNIHTVSISDIIYAESENRKMIIHTVTDDYESVHNMQYWMKALNQKCFFQSHRSFIVNFKYVSGFDHNLIYLYNDQFQAYLTRRKYTQFKETYLLYLESTR